MALRNFDTPLDASGVTQVPVTARPVTHVAVESRVSVTQQPSAARAYLAKGDQEWAWQDLRDYVVGQIESRFGVFPRDARKESGIFKSFLTRYPKNAAAIARFAFEVNDGYWAGAPISVTRFCRGSDPFFADPISERLVTDEVQGW